MEALRKIELSDKELNSLKSKRIGSGTESIVYNGKNNLAYKIYRTDSELLRESPTYSLDDIRFIYSEENIIEAMRRQPYVSKTDLPVCPIYHDDRFIGCALKKHNFCVPIQNIMILPIKNRIIILRRLLDAVKELCDNYIYHIDLSVKEIDTSRHSNVLVGMDGKPQIIDLDGKSTIYTPSYNSNLEYRSYVSLCALITEILFDIDVEEVEEEYEVDTSIARLVDYGISYSLAEDIIRLDVSHEKIDEVLKMSMRK